MSEVKHETSINRTVKTCAWIIGSVGDGVTCGDATRWHLSLDDDGNRVRNYDHFCPIHKEVDSRLREILKEYL